MVFRVWTRLILISLAIREFCGRIHHSGGNVFQKLHGIKECRHASGPNRLKGTSRKVKIYSDVPALHFYISVVLYDSPSDECSSRFRERWGGRFSRIAVIAIAIVRWSGILSKSFKFGLFSVSSDRVWCLQCIRCDECGLVYALNYRKDESK